MIHYNFLPVLFFLFWNSFNLRPFFIQSLGLPIGKISLLQQASIMPMSHKKTTVFDINQQNESQKKNDQFFFLPYRKKEKILHKNAMGFFHKTNHQNNAFEN